VKDGCCCTQLRRPLALVLTRTPLTAARHPPSHRRKQLGLADSITLLPESQDDAQEAALALFAADDGSKFRSSWQGKRRKIMTEGIMPAGGGGGGAAAGSGRGGGGRGGGGRRGGGRGVGPVLSPAAQALAARVVRKGGKGSLPGL
jgi:uncharacterized membrane protein YgcG